MDKYRLPETKEEGAKFVKFLYNKIAKVFSTSGAITVAVDGHGGCTHCHTACALYVKKHQARDALWVILGAPGKYDITHSVLVSKDESEILVDTFDMGYFQGGYYFGAERMPNGKLTRTNKFTVYAVFKAGDLMDLGHHLRDFVPHMEALKMPNFNGHEIHKRPAPYLIMRPKRNGGSTEESTSASGIKLKPAVVRKIISAAASALASKSLDKEELDNLRWKKNRNGSIFLDSPDRLISGTIQEKDAEKHGISLEQVEAYFAANNTKYKAPRTRKTRTLYD